MRATSLEALAAAITRHARNFKTYSDDLPHGSCHPLAKEPKLGRVKARHSPLLGVASVLGHRRLPDRKMPPQGTLNCPEAHLSRLLSSPSPGTGFRPGAAWMPQAADAPPRCLYRFVPRQDPLQSTTDTTAQTRSSEGTRLCLTCRRSGGSQPQKKHSLRNHDLPVSQLTLVKARVSMLVALPRASVHLGLMHSCPLSSMARLLKLAIAYTLHEAKRCSSRSISEANLEGGSQSSCRCKTASCFCRDTMPQ